MNSKKNTTNRSWVTITCLLLLCLHSALYGQKIYPLPTWWPELDRVTESDNLKKIADQTTETPLLLGLAFLAKTGDPVRQEILDRILKMDPELSPVAEIIGLTMDGIDEASVNRLIRVDPENALGHYLRGQLLYDSDKVTEAISSFEEAAACPDLRLYETITGEALIASLDALELKGKDRLSALSWMASRSFNFSVFAFQRIGRSINELAKEPGNPKRNEESELLLIWAGHLFASNFNNKWYADRALESAFRLKAEIAAEEKSPVMNGYTAVVQALASVRLSWPGIKDYSVIDHPVELARFLPNRIHRAFAIADPDRRSTYKLGEFNVILNGSEKANFEKATLNAEAAAKGLIEEALKAPDAIVGAYLKGRSERNYENGPWVSYYSPVEKMMQQHPAVLNAAAAFETSLNAVYDAGKGDLRRKNMSRLMQIGLGIITYASDHGDTFPPSLELLFKEDILKPPLEPKSMITSKPYRYIRAGEKIPKKGKDRASYILIYDGDALPDGTYQCIMGDGHGEYVPVQQLQDMLDKKNNVSP